MATMNNVLYADMFPDIDSTFNELAIQRVNEVPIVLLRPHAALDRQPEAFDDP
jgi:hypothetical protein